MLGHEAGQAQNEQQRHQGMQQRRSDEAARHPLPARAARQDQPILISIRRQSFGACLAPLNGGAKDTLRTRNNRTLRAQQRRCRINSRRPARLKAGRLPVRGRARRAASYEQIEAALSAVIQKLLGQSV